MDSICFSVAETLRCAGLTKEESLYLLIPALIEGVIGLPLLYIKWGRGRMYWLFVLEGVSYTTLALLDYFAHTRASTINDATTFKIIDIVVGATSFIPLGAYLVFLWLFSRSALFPLLSRKYETLVSRALFVSLPIIIAFNEISAFLGISYTTAQNADGQFTLGVGFLSKSTLGPWNVIANTTLALVTVVQLVHFVFAFLHFFQKAYRGDRMFSGSERDIRLYSLKGTGWLSAGLKLGAVETVIGFAGFGFAPTILRRVLRVLGRGFLLVGVCISPDAPDTEGFTIFTNPRTSEGGDGRRPNLRALISQPRADTFRRLSANATGFYGLPRAADAEKGGAALSRNATERVTVRFNSQRTPVLEMRFSDLDIRAAAGLPARSRASSVYSDPTSPPRRWRGQSVASITSDSADAVRRLAAQFPSLPPRATLAARTTLADMPEEDADPADALRRKLSRRKPPPPLAPVGRSVGALRTAESFVMVSPYIDDDTVDYEPPTPTSGVSSGSWRRISNTTRTWTDRTPGTTPLQSPPATLRKGFGGFGFGRLAARAAADSQVDHTRSASRGSVLTTAEARSTAGTPESAPRLLTHARVFSADSAAETAFGSSLGADSVLSSGAGTGRRRRTPEVPQSARFDSTEVLSIPWLAGGGAEVSRMKSVGAHSTPAPTPGGARARGSVVPETMQSPFGDGQTVVMHERGRSVDSGVLSADDRAMLRGSMMRERGEIVFVGAEAQ